MQYLVWLTAEKFEGLGALVDLGSWLGASSAALAEGLRRRGSEAKVQSLDLFTWDRTYMERVAPRDLPQGGDFLPAFLQEVGEYRAWIEPHRVDLLTYRWTGGPIDILFVDAAKTWELLNAILAGFGEALIPCRSRVVWQDFRFHGTHQLPLVMDSRPDIWREVESVEDGWTVTFMPLKALYGPAGLSADYSEDAFPLPAAEHLLRSRMAREAPGPRDLLLRTLYRKYLIDSSPEEAEPVKRELLADRGPPLDPEELALIEDVSNLSWEAIRRGEYARGHRLAKTSLALGRRSTNALAMMAFLSLRLKAFDEAEPYICEILEGDPHFPHGKLFRASLRIAQCRYDEATQDVRDVLWRSQRDEAIIEWALNLLEQAWEGGGRRVHPAAELLGELKEVLATSPVFWTAVARLQIHQGHKEEARLSLEEALKLAPGHALASQYYEKL